MKNDYLENNDKSSCRTHLSKSLNIYIKHTKLQNASKVILCNIFEWKKLYKYYIRDKHDLKLAGSVLLGNLFDDGYRMMPQNDLNYWPNVRLFLVLVTKRGW